MLFQSEDETVVQALQRAQQFYKETADKCDKDSAVCRAKVVELAVTIAQLSPPQEEPNGSEAA